MKEPTMLTTIDNPYNPFSQYDEWNQWDIDNGYHTLSLLARVHIGSDTIDDDSIIDSQREIVLHNTSGKHILVTDRNFDAVMKIQSSLYKETND
jgi:hypothetical protein